MTPALISIHDVAPASLPAVQRILKLLNAHRIEPVTLLIIPGSGWDADSVSQLRQWQRRGLALAGHGWHHRSGPIRTLGHRAHAFLLSRRAAEHLSRPTAELVELLERCHAWFGEQGLESPTLYVPPAWGLGALARRHLQAAPFRLYETLGGLYDSRNDRFTFLPVVGFEADTRARRTALRILNRANRSIARWRQHPVRIAIHPTDLDLLLADDLRSVLQAPFRWTTYDDLC